jgi:hypothetical protein
MKGQRIDVRWLDGAPLHAVQDCVRCLMRDDVLGQAGEDPACVQLVIDRRPEVS